jgi:hypothetical protein
MIKRLPVSVHRLKNKRVLDYKNTLKESIQNNKSLLKLLYDKYIPVKAEGINTGIYEIYNGEKIVIKWNEKRDKSGQALTINKEQPLSIVTGVAGQGATIEESNITDYA